MSLGDSGNISEWSDQNPTVVKSRSFQDWCRRFQVPLGEPVKNLREYRRSGDYQRSNWESWQQACKHLRSQWSRQGKTKSSLKILLVHLRIITTTYRCMIFKTHIFCLYSDSCTLSMNLYSYPSTHSISRMTSGGVWEQFKVNQKMTIKCTQRYTWKSWSSKIADTHGSHNQVNLEMHCEAVIEWLWKWTCRP